MKGIRTMSAPGGGGGGGGGGGSPGDPTTKEACNDMITAARKAKNGREVMRLMKLRGKLPSGGAGVVEAGVDEAPAVPARPAPARQLPPGWSKVESKSKPGKFYWFNEDTGKTSWKFPEAPAVPAYLGGLRQYLEALPEEEKTDPRKMEEATERFRKQFRQRQGIEDGEGGGEGTASNIYINIQCSEIFTLINENYIH